MKKDNLFWISYSDIMTALFFIMLVLFVVAATFFQEKYKEASVLKKEKQEIKNIQAALGSLSPKYFKFDEDTKRYSLNINVKFPTNGYEMDAVGQNVKNKLYKAGKNLYNKIDSLTSDNLTSENNEVYYLLIIQGNAQRNETNYKIFPNVGYRLSYKRALALFNFWKDSGLNFYNFGKRCEVIIAGSGYFGLSRYSEGSSKNRRFTLQITSKWSLNESDSTSI